MENRRATLRAVKAFHTLAWFSIEACMAYLLYAGFRGDTDRRAAAAAAVVGGETLVFVGNGFRCPLTPLAQRLGDSHGSVTDIYLPRWFAHNLPAIHVPLLVLAIALHTRNARRARQDSARLDTRPATGYRDAEYQISSMVTKNPVT